MLPKTNPSRFGRRLLKRVLYSQMTMMNVVNILRGKTEPQVSFTVKDNPSSVYFNFRVKPSKIKEFEKYLNMPEGFEVCPIRCLRGEKADVLLTLNVYEVSGITNGIRGEWSTYIRDKEGKPRYMVVEAQSSQTSMDPVDVITQKGIVIHEEQADRITTQVGDREKHFFEAEITLDPKAPMADIHGEWIEANDYIYWRNGICDRCYYDAGMANAQARLIDPKDVSIDDQTHWTPFLQKKPKHVIKWEGAIGLMIMPWYGL